MRTTLNSPELVAHLQAEGTVASVGESQPESPAHVRAIAFNSLPPFMCLGAAPAWSVAAELRLGE